MENTKTADIYCSWAKAAYKTWGVPGYDTAINPPEPRGGIGIFIDDCINMVQKQRGYKKVFAILNEPRIKQTHIYETVQTRKNEFTKILTHDNATLKLCGHAILVPFGGSWVRAYDPSVKKNRISIILSNKAKRNSELDGYRMRRFAADYLKELGMTIHGTGGIPIPEDTIKALGEGKAKILGPSEFAVEAECHKKDNWFTEKLLDCINMLTVPIYYGPDNIGDFFDTSGMVLWNTETEFKTAISEILDGSIKYSDFIKPMTENKKAAEKYSSISDKLSIISENT